MIGSGIREGSRPKIPGSRQDFPSRHISKIKTDFVSGLLIMILLRIKKEIKDIINNIGLGQDRERSSGCEGVQNL
jgi:hypothetical protein